MRFIPSINFDRSVEPDLFLTARLVVISPMMVDAGLASDVVRAMPPMRRRRRPDNCHERRFH
jgi:hypothetical protein